MEPGGLKVGTLGIKSLVGMFCVCVGCGWGLRDATKPEGKILEPITSEGNINKNILSKWLGRWYPVYKTLFVITALQSTEASLCCWKSGRGVRGGSGLCSCCPPLVSRVELWMVGVLPLGWEFQPWYAHLCPQPPHPPAEIHPEVRHRVCRACWDLPAFREEVRSLWR